jgi:hypothetical protein
MINLQDHIEDISDDFQSTFTQVDHETLANMLNGPDEFQEVTRIIQKHYKADVTFKKTNQLGNNNYKNSFDNDNR